MSIFLESLKNASKQNGRPPLYKDVKELTKRIEAYFKWCEGERVKRKMKVQKMDEKGRPVYSAKGDPEFEFKMIEVWAREPEKLTITGLSLFLGFESRQSIYDYSKNGNFSYIIKRVLQVIEKQYELMVQGTTPTGAIFVLKNMGWDGDQLRHITSDDSQTVKELSKLPSEKLKEIRKIIGSK